MSHHHKNHGQGKGSKNEGEGNRTADHAYTEGVKSFIASDKVEPAALEAKTFVEENPTQAERDDMAGRAGPKPFIHRIEELATEGKAMFDRAVMWVKSVIEKRRHAR